MAPMGLRTIDDFAKRGYFYLTGDRSRREEFFDFITNQVENFLREGKPDRAGVWLGEIVDIIEKKFSTVHISDEVVEEAFVWLTKNLDLIVEAARRAQTGLGRFAPLALLTKYLPISYEKNIWKSVDFSILLDVIILVYHTLKFQEKYGRSPDGVPYKHTIALAKQAVVDWSITRVVKMGLARDVGIESKPDEKIRKVILSGWAKSAFEIFESEKNYEALAFVCMLDGMDLLIKSFKLAGVVKGEKFKETLKNAVLRNVEESEVIFSELYGAIKSSIEHGEHQT